MPFGGVGGGGGRDILPLSIKFQFIGGRKIRRYSNDGSLKKHGASSRF